jgi:hypothetical protein
VNPPCGHSPKFKKLICPKAKTIGLDYQKEKIA